MASIIGVVGPPPSLFSYLVRPTVTARPANLVLNNGRMSLRHVVLSPVKLLDRVGDRGYLDGLEGLHNGVARRSGRAASTAHSSEQRPPR